ncbi:hypothetical protein [Actinomadura algeriensis]|uniref:ABC transporter permease n=1 Tax=Actinomadura algeriensis TaxID=1679523 RepID=A0ABR9JXL0_9ACTN|nr:hypothetical protein [Actinomadura algeriensis]MBE1535312.1 hypothetical protein [Actinomadura algeriensis]
MRGPTGKRVATGLVTALIMMLLGPLAGLLWAWTSPEVTYVIFRGDTYLADPESQAPIGTDIRFALIVLVAGAICGGAAYLAGGRGNDIALLLGLAAGGVLAGVLAWRTGHMIGLDEFRAAVRAAADRERVTGVAELRARGPLVFWAVAAVGVYGVLELFVRRLPARDGGDLGAGEPDEVGGTQLDLQSAPTGGDVDRREG